MKKIFFYINAIHHGGAERVMVNLANCLKDRYECFLITSIRESWEYPLDEGVKRISLFEDDLPSSFIKRNLSLTKKLRSLVLKEKPDVLISFMAEPNFRAILSKRNSSTKCIISIRNDPHKEYPNFIFRIAAKILYPFTDGVVFQTKDAKDYFSKKIQNKSRIIFNQVDEKFYNTPLLSKREGIITTGRLVDQKNHEMLIRAFSSVADSVTDNLYIYGEGELKSHLEDVIRELHMEQRVFLMGSSKNVPEILSKANVFVLSSDFEGMPNSLLEAMAMGLPCISTDCPCGGPKSIIKNGENGLLTTVGCADELSEAIKSICCDTDFKDKIAKNARLSANEFNSETVLNNWINYIENVSSEEK